MPQIEFFTIEGNAEISDHHLEWKVRDFCFNQLWLELGEPTGWPFWDSDLKKIYGTHLGPQNGERFFAAKRFRRQVHFPAEYASFRVNDESYLVVEVAADSGIAVGKDWQQLGIHLASRTQPAYVAAQDCQWLYSLLKQLQRNSWLHDKDERVDWNAVLELVGSSKSEVLIIPPYPRNLWRHHTDMLIHAGQWESAHTLKWPGDREAIDAQQEEWKALVPQTRFELLHKAWGSSVRLAPDTLQTITYADHIGPRLVQEARAAKKR